MSPLRTTKIVRIPKNFAFLFMFMYNIYYVYQQRAGFVLLSTHVIVPFHSLHVYIWLEKEGVLTELKS